MLSDSRQLSLFFLISFLLAESSAQFLPTAQSQFAKVPYYNGMQQGLALGRDSTSNSLTLFMGFDLGEYGIIKKYNLKLDESFENRLVDIGSLVLPARLKHPNDLKLKGDTLLVVGHNGRRTTHLATLDARSGQILKEWNDTLAAGWHLQFAFFFNEVLFRGITDEIEVKVQYLTHSGKFVDESLLSPSPYRSLTNYIQGSEVLDDSILAVITSNPTRVDFFHMLKNYEYLGSIAGEDTPYYESQGLAQIRVGKSIHLYYGVGGLQRVNELIIIAKSEIQTPQLINRTDSFELSSAFPNPFRGLTNIFYALKSPQQVEITVTDVVGRVVHVFKDAGGNVGLQSHTIRMLNYPAGIYFCRLTVGKDMKVLKLISLR